MRYYGEVKAPNKPGEMAGVRLVREWGIRWPGKEDLVWNGWSGWEYRQVRPDPRITGGIKKHYMYDIGGNYIGCYKRPMQTSTLNN